MASSRFLPDSLLSYLAVLTAVSSSVRADPIEATWADATFGPDGPWKAINVSVGGSAQSIAMFPGSEWTSVVLTTDYCSYNNSIACDATRAGLYNKELSELGGSGSSALIAWQPGKDFMSGMDVTGEDLTMWVDDMTIGGSTVSNVSMALLGENFAVYPNDNLMPFSVSCLGLGAPKNVNQTFSETDAPAVNASLIPGFLWQHGSIASNSFGLHIGSASPDMDGSLYFGGYDQNRIVGDILTGSGSIHSPIALKDISIAVIDGSSPFEFDKMSGILAMGNHSINSAGIEVAVDGCSPYLTLPKSTCDTIASYLPVTYDKNLGLYTWNTDDKKYQQIVSSASALQFTFLSGTNMENVTISVPFPHLNLTLDSPLVDTPTPYFPCFVGADKYSLGRAFLQDAFIGANWGANTWWLAQAPGPNIPNPNVAELGNDDTAIKASANDWKESWAGSWSALTPDQVASTTVPEASSTPTTTPSSDSKGGLASGAAIGVGVGVGVGAVLIFGALAIFFFRRRRNAAAAAAAAKNGAGGSSDSAGPSDGSAQAPNQAGWYQPVKQGEVAGSPGVGVPLAYGSPGQQPQYSQYSQYSSQHSPYGAPGQLPQYYAQELPTEGHTPMELPGSQPQPYEAHLIGIHPSHEQQQQQQ